MRRVSKPVLAIAALVLAAGSATALVVPDVTSTASVPATPASVQLPPLRAVEVTLSGLDGHGPVTESVRSLGTPAELASARQDAARTSAALSRPAGVPGTAKAASAPAAAGAAATPAAAGAAATAKAAVPAEGITVEGVTGAATRHPATHAHAVSDTPASVTNLGSGLDLAANGASTFTVGTAGSGGMRYVYANLEVRNAQACSTPGTCTAYTEPSHNLTLVAAETAGTLAQTAVSKVKLFDGTTPSNAATLATQMLPTDGVAGNGNDADHKVYPEPGLESLQVFSEAEVAAMTPLSGVTSLLPYGYVVRNLVNPKSRSLNANPAANAYQGGVTIALAFPTQTTATQNPFAISLVYQPVDDTNTRVTQSLEEDNQRGDGTAGARAAALSSQDLAVLGAGGHTTATNVGDPICTVRTAGTAAAPTAYLVNAGTNANLASLPYSLTTLSRTGAINAGFCSNMTTPAGIFSQFVVSGSQSGTRTSAGHYSGNYVGGGSNVISFTPSQTFFTGEKVSLSITAGLTSSGGKHPAAFVGSAFVGGQPASRGRFTPYRSSDIGNQFSNFIATADFNGDGILDAAVVSGASGSMLVYFGNGDGTYGYPYTYAINGDGGYRVETADFNGDGRPDLVTVAFGFSGGGKATVFLNQGNGVFNSGTSFTLSASSSSSGIAIGDFNGDGHPDIAIANYGETYLTLLTGNGAGGFTQSTITGVGSGAYGLVAGDFTGDGKTDLAVAISGSSGSVNILSGNGAGGFTLVSSMSIPGDPLNLVTADFNGDGRPDLAVDNGNTSNIYVLINQGGGSFNSTAVGGPAGATEAFGLTTADFNQDGHPDLAVQYENAQSVDIATFLNDGSGNLSRSSVAYVDNLNLAELAAGDVNNDGVPDVLLSTGAAPFSLLGDGTGALGTASAAGQQLAGTTGTNPRAEVLADFNGDGRLDIATANSGSNSLTIMLSNASGGFTVSSVGLSLSPVAIVAGDFDGDGNVDLAVTSSGGVVIPLKGSGTGTFTAQASKSVGTGVTGMVVGDFNGDGRPDIALSDTGADFYSTLLNTGSFGFTATNVAEPSGTTSTFSAIDAGDLNADGKLDLVMTDSTANVVQVFTGAGNGTFTAGATYSVAGSPKAVAIADINKDGLADIVTASSTGSATLLLASATGGYTGTSFTVGRSPSALTVGDINGDGYLDVVVANAGGNNATELLGGPAGLTLPPQPSFATVGNPVSIALGDFGGTHRLSAVVTGAVVAQVWVAPQLG